METDDEDKVQGMLDRWCKIDISVDGMSLIDKAKEKGNVNIIAMLQVKMGNIFCRVQ